MKLFPNWLIGTSGVFCAVSLLTHSAAPQATSKIWRYNYADFDRAKETLAQVNAASVIVDGDVSVSWSNWEIVLGHNGELHSHPPKLSHIRNLP